MVDLPQGSSVEATTVPQQAASRAATIAEVHSLQTYAGLPPRSISMDWSGTIMCGHRRNSATFRSTLRERANETAAATRLPLNCAKSEGPRYARGNSCKTVEPPPGPPVLATLLAEIYGPTPEARRATAAKVRKPLPSCLSWLISTTASELPHHGCGLPMTRTILNIRGEKAQRLRHAAIALCPQYRGLLARGSKRKPIPITLGLAVQQGQWRTLAKTPVPTNPLPGDRGVVELGDVVNVSYKPLHLRFSATMGSPLKW